MQLTPMFRDVHVFQTCTQSSNGRVPGTGMYGMTGPLMRVNAATQAVFDAWGERGAAAEDALIQLTQTPNVNVNATAEYKCTMLHTAAAANWARWALLLLGMGAKVDARNSVEETPLLVRTTPDGGAGEEGGAGAGVVVWLVL